VSVRLSGYPAGFPSAWKVTITVAVSKDKVILFASATHNKARHLWPVAVFNEAPAAKSYATFLRLAYRADDGAAIALLDPTAHKDDAGQYLKDTKWSLVTVPYAPQPSFEEDGATEDATE
jgi:hypothetical protein